VVGILTGIWSPADEFPLPEGLLFAGCFLETLLTGSGVATAALSADPNNLLKIFIRAPV